jgi:hypothetical protein
MSHPARRAAHLGNVLFEASLVVGCAALALTLLASARGSFGWSWDALNHHIYLGMIAEKQRWANDVAAAASQTYQYPYLYWPAYRLSLAHGSGAGFGALWAAIQAALIMMPIWVLTFRLFPDGEARLEARAYRLLACALALSSLPVIAVLGTTANDVLAALPVLWAIAIGIGFPGRWWSAVGAAALLGVAVAFKYSSVLLLPALAVIAWQPAVPRLPLRLLSAMALALVVGFAVLYLPWGWQLWRQTGNPFYPHFGSLFSG